MIYRLILSKWVSKDLNLKYSRSGEFSDEQLAELNALGYNIYYLPNHPSKPVHGRPSNGRDVDVWSFVFADMDLKDKKWPSKKAFIDSVNKFALKPSAIVDSGRGVHVYWKVSDLDAMSFLRLQRRIAIKFQTDPAVSNMHQLMRVPGWVNVKDPDPEKWMLCEVVDSCDAEYDSQTMDKNLPKITLEDEVKCKDHYDKTMLDPSQLAPKDAAKLPDRWFQLLKTNAEVKKLFNYDGVRDRSSADFRLAHLLLANDFNRDEARAVLMNTGKALERTSVHQFNYAQRMVEKLWEEVKVGKDPTPVSSIKAELDEELGETVSEVIRQSKETPRATRFPCHEAIDATHHGYRLGQFLGLVGGSGAGKTTFCLNMFKWFYQRNPEYIHIFVSLEQPKDEIAERWERMVGNDPVLHSKVYIIGNYDKKGIYRNLGLKEIETYIKKLEAKTGKKVGCVVIDHIAILKYERETKEMKDKLSGLCEQSKQFAVSTNTFTIVQSQTSRSKAGVGDIELDKDAAYGTGYFEFYADYIVTTWQPLKRLYGEPGYAEKVKHYINCWKYCKIRNKKADKDKTQEDQVYAFKLDLSTDSLSKLSPDDHISIESLLKKAVQMRGRDKKTNPAPMRVISWATPEDPNPAPVSPPKRLTAEKKLTPKDKTP